MHNLMLLEIVAKSMGAAGVRLSQTTSVTGRNAAAIGKRLCFHAIPNKNDKARPESRDTSEPLGKTSSDLPKDLFLGTPSAR
jgi:hypothetical protein